MTDLRVAALQFAVRSFFAWNEAVGFALPEMAHIVFSDFREPAAEQAYEIAWDYLARSGTIRDEFEACVFLAQRVTMMVGDGHANKIRMANQAISEYQRYVRECERLIRYGGEPGDGY